MSEATRPLYITGTGNVGPASGGILHSIVLTPAAADATLTLREGGSDGSIIAVVKAPANTASVPVFFEGAYYQGQLHATLAGAGAVATIEL